MRRRITHRPECQAKRVGHEEGARRLDDRRDFGDLGEGEGAQPRLVEDPLGQSNGLLADRSGRCEEHQVGPILDELPRDRRGGPLQEWVRVGDVAHERVNLRGEAADATLSHRGV